MSTTLQFRRGNSAATAAVTGAEGELFINTQTKTIHVHDGSTTGGIALANASSVTAAISTASSDATTKAGTAYSNATSYADTAAATSYSNATSYADTAAATSYSNATSFAANASNLTTGTVPTARLGSGTADATTVLYGNGVWAAVTGGGGGSVDLTSISSDVTPSVSGVYNIGTTAAKWYGLNVSNSITINGARLSGASNTLSTTSNFVAGALLADNLLISDNLITPDSTTARQYLGTKGIVVINGNLDVQGDWLKTPVAETVNVSTTALVNTTFTTSAGDFGNEGTWAFNPGAVSLSVSGSFTTAANTYIASLRAGDTIVSVTQSGTITANTFIITGTPTNNAGQWSIPLSEGDTSLIGSVQSVTFRKSQATSTTSVPLTTGTVGAMRYNRDLSLFQGHDGTSWNTVVTSSGNSASSSLALGRGTVAYVPGSYVYNPSLNGLSPTVEVTTDVSTNVSSGTTYYTSFLDGTNASSAYTNSNAINLSQALGGGYTQNCMAMLTVHFLVHARGPQDQWKIVEIKAALVQNGLTSTWSYNAISSNTIATGGGSDIAEITPTVLITNGSHLNQKIEVGSADGLTIHVTGKYRFETLQFSS